MASVELHDVTKEYDGGRGAIRAIDGITLSASEGEFVAIVGPSGCGKSTLLKIIGDIIEPTGGSVTVGGIPAREARLNGLFSYVFQNPVLLQWRNVVENVRLPLEVLGRNSRDPGDLLKMVGLGGYEALYPRELSGGMQHRVALARALTFDPRVLLMDEPFGALDELTRDSLNVELLQIWRQINVTVFFVTHSISEAVFLSDRVVLLTGRPARIKLNRDITFERPRDIKIRETEPFQEIVKCLRAELE